jgi:hypothetical protein
LTGWYRTGTTYLHNLLASQPNLRVPLFWQLRGRIKDLILSADFDIRLSFIDSCAISPATDNKT